MFTFVLEVFISTKWKEMFGAKKEEVVEEVKVKKPRKQAVAKKPTKEAKKAGKGRSIHQRLQIRPL